MSNQTESIATPLVRGALAAIVSLGTALALVVVPALAAQVVATRSSATALDAILIALNLLVLGHGGGLVLTTGAIDGAVTLTPLGLLLLLVVLCAAGMRRVGRALLLVREDGVLRDRALRDAGGALGLYVLVYAIGLALVAAISRSALVSPVLPSALVSGAMVAMLGGLAGLLWSLRREATATVPGVRVLELLPRPWGSVARATLFAVAGLLALGLATVLVMLLLSVPAQSALFAQLDPGPVGGLVLSLIQLALLPLLAVWALVVLSGGTVELGTSTGISLDGAETGVLPALPMLGALPQPGDFPDAVWGLIVLPAVPVVLGAVRLVRDLEDLPWRERVTAWIGYPVAVLVGTVLIVGLATGGIGEGRLSHLGPVLDELLLPLALIVLVPTVLVIGVLGSGLIPWLRQRVERAETAERAELTGEGRRSAGGTAGSGADGGSRADGGAASRLERVRRALAARLPRRAAASPESPASAGSARTPASAGTVASPASPTPAAASPDSPGEDELSRPPRS